MQINVLTFLGYKKDDIDFYISSLSKYKNIDLIDKNHDFGIKDYKKWKKYN